MSDLFRPILPPIDGFVEVLGEDGEHILVETEEHEKKVELEKENALLKAQVDAQADRSEFIEDCIAEMAMQVYSNV